MSPTDDAMNVESEMDPSGVPSSHLSRGARGKFGGLSMKLKRSLQPAPEPRPEPVPTAAGPVQRSLNSARISHGSHNMSKNQRETPSDPSESGAA